VLTRSNSLHLDFSFSVKQLKLTLWYQSYLDLHVALIPMRVSQSLKYTHVLLFKVLWWLVKVLAEPYHHAAAVWPATACTWLCEAHALVSALVTFGVLLLLDWCNLDDASQGKPVFLADIHFFLLVAKLLVVNVDLQGCYETTDF
jgi:hypothetical protein